MEEKKIRGDSESMKRKNQGTDTSVDADGGGNVHLAAMTTTTMATIYGGRQYYNTKRRQGSSCECFN